ncbi:MAG: flavin reductase family protein [Candidatus Izemoplasmataceae bacterium]|jgi:flavin reductase (DIM6/NTAB) family NADH-FMN oxidoreductase RutF|uniref:flavin reductase family protein n=1 Tax=Liberiplasma polymorphum TaxID=3374570 RepID=UPI003774C3BC
MNLIINPNELDKNSLYKLLTGTVLPRPIALVLTKGKEGIINIAPFSYFNLVSIKPVPRIAFTVQHLENGLKDTTRNIMESKEFVVHVVTEDILEDTNETAANLPPLESELKRTSFKLVDNDLLAIPRIAQAKVAFECTLDQIVTFESADMIIGRIERIHILDSIYEEGRIDIEKLSPIGRLAGNDYTTLGKTIKLRRPTV